MKRREEDARRKEEDATRKAEDARKLKLEAARSSSTSPRMVATASCSAWVMSIQSASMRPSLESGECHWVQRVRKDFSWISLAMPALAASSALEVAARIRCSVAFRLPVEILTRLVLP